MYSSKIYLIIFNNLNRITHQSQNNNVQRPKFNIESYYITREACVNNINTNNTKKSNKSQTGKSYTVRGLENVEFSFVLL